MTTEIVLPAAEAVKRPLRKRLFKQLALSITMFIFLIEFVVFGFSYIAKKDELYDLRDTLEQDVLNKTGEHFNDLHPGILDEPDIDRRLKAFAINVTLITIAISIVVSLGTLFVFHKIAGRYVMRIIELNSRYDGHKLDETTLYTDEKLPSNELADLIVTRNQMIESIMRHQAGIQAQLDEARQQLVHSAKLSMVGELTATMMHDIKNPLAVVVGRTYLLKQRSEDPIWQEGLASIEAAAHKITSLTDRMGKFVRLADSKMERVDLAQSIENSLDMLGSRLNQLGVRVVRNLSPGIVLTADPIALEQVFTNLISNAGDAMTQSPNRILTVHACRKGDFAVIDVVDSGIGIAADKLEKVFMAFYTTKEVGHGTGLGLSSAKRIVEQHGGHIHVKSEIGHGTEFTILLPLQPPVAATRENNPGGDVG